MKKRGGALYAGFAAEGCVSIDTGRWNGNRQCRGKPWVDLEGGFLKAADLDGS